MSQAPPAEGRPEASTPFNGLGDDSQVPAPEYGDNYGAIDNDEGGLGTHADVTADGRINVRIDQKTRGLSSLLVPALRNQLDLLGLKKQAPYVPPTFASAPGEKPPPPLNIVIHVVGSRGDVQPFVALGKVLKEQYHHRVRLATHPVFKDFVTENGLEFFSIAGDPAELMAFMVKNPGLMPAFDTLRRGDVGRRRREISTMIRRCWRSCIETGDGSGVEASDKDVEDWSTNEETFGGASDARPFVADAIIANPPSFAHIHCAEKLGIPLHMMFTMPWSPTQAFPHPLANIQSTNADANMTNLISYGLVDMMTWQGLGDVINRFRQKSLGLEPISATWAPGMLSRLKVPWTYCWSPALIPKPPDWGAHISISGFYFLNLATNYTPEPDLAAFLEAGPPPVYIGFGSIVVDDPNAMTKLIFEAVVKTGQRALVSKGWGGFGADQIGIPEGVFMLGNVPHDWLFKRVSAVVHHGGAGTTAAGIACGKPSVVVPFFGDQPFWGAMVARAGAGPNPIPYKKLTSDQLAESIQHALLPASLEKAKALAESISAEQGTEVGADDFHHKLKVDELRCTLCPERVAVWRIRRTQIRLSAFAATVLGNEKLVDFADLKLCRPREHFTEDEPFDPVSGAASALVGTMGSMAMGIADMPTSALKALNIHPDAQKARAGTKPPTSPNRQASGDSKPSTLTPTQSDIEMQTIGGDSSSNAELSRSGTASSDTADHPEAANAIANQMAQAASAMTKTSTESGSESQASEQTSSSNKAPKDMKATVDAAVGAGKGIFKIASAGIKSPMDFTLGLARGFHNAPKLYGDESVRKSEKITGFSSGVRVASKEFGFGFYDGISGLVTQPFEGAKKEGAAGFLKGMGKGLGGIVLKPGAAIWGLPGYTAAGIYKELQKRFGPNVQNYIIASRTAQGYEDVSKSTEADRRSIVNRWKAVEPYIKKKKASTADKKGQEKKVKGRSKDTVDANYQGVSAAEDSQEQESPAPPQYEEGEALSINKPALIRKASTKTTQTSMTDDTSASSPRDTDSISIAPTLSSMTTLTEKDHPPPYTPQPTEKGGTSDGFDDWEFEEAVRRSVQETSTGNPEEDALIERAIRASVAELAAAKAEGADGEQLQQAMEASIQQATRGLRENRDANQDSAASKGKRHAGADAQSAEGSTHSDRELQEALTASEKSDQVEESEDEKSRREEEIVMQYVMRQSKMEEEMRQKKDQADSKAT